MKILYYAILFILILLVSVSVLQLYGIVTIIPIAFTTSTTTTTTTTTTIPTTTTTTLITTTTIPPSDKIVILQMDDCQISWLEETCVNIVNLHIEKNADMTIGFIPMGMTENSSWKPHLQNWTENYTGLIEIAEHTYNHSSQYIGWSAQAIADDMQKGLDLFAQWNIRPYTFIPAFGWVENTTDGADIAGFHSVLDSLENPYDYGWVGDILVIHDGVYCGDGYNSCVNEKYNSLKALIDNATSRRGYAIILFHPQDFGSVGSSKYNTLYSKWSSNLDKLKNDGYTFITAEEYYQMVK